MAVSGAGSHGTEEGQVNLPLGVTVAFGEITIMVAVSVLVLSLIHISEPTRP